MILYTLYFILFVFGLCIGSFLNDVIYRLPACQRLSAAMAGREKGESVFFSENRSRSSTPRTVLGRYSLSRSYCPHCKTILRWYDLIPFFSFLFLRGRCRYCSKQISIQYPIVEIITGILFVSVAHFSLPTTDYRLLLNWKDIFYLCYLLYVICSLIIIFVYDLKHYIIPDKILFPAIAISIIYHVLSIMIAENYTLYINNTLYYAGSAVIASGFFLALVLASRGKWMGLGDVKLAFLMGLVLGWPDVLVALFLAFALGAAVGLTLILISREPFSVGERFSRDYNLNYSLRSQIPFGPFLIVGTFVSLFWGARIVGWYWGLLF